MAMAPGGRTMSSSSGAVGAVMSATGGVGDVARNRRDRQLDCDRLTDLVQPWHGRVHGNAPTSEASACVPSKDSAVRWSLAPALGGRRRPFGARPKGPFDVARMSRPR